MFCHVATNVLRCLRVVLVVLPRGIERFLKVLQTESSGLQFFRFLMWVVKSKGAENADINFLFLSRARTLVPTMPTAPTRGGRVWWVL